MIPFIVPHRTRIRVEPKALRFLSALSSNELSITGVVHDAAHLLLPNLWDETLQPSQSPRGLYMYLDPPSRHLFIQTHMLSESRRYDIPFFHFLYLFCRGILYFLKYRPGWDAKESQMDKLCSGLQSIRSSVREFKLVLLSGITSDEELSSIQKKYLPSLFAPFWDDDQERVVRSVRRKIVLDRSLQNGVSSLSCVVVSGLANSTDEMILEEELDLSRRRHLVEILESTLVKGSDVSFFVRRILKIINRRIPAAGSSRSLMGSSENLAALREESVRRKREEEERRRRVRERMESMTPANRRRLGLPVAAGVGVGAQTKKGAVAAAAAAAAAALKRSQYAAYREEREKKSGIEGVRADVVKKLPEFYISKELVDDYFAEHYWKSVRIRLLRSYAKALKRILLPCSDKRLDENNQTILANLFGERLRPRFALLGSRARVAEARLRLREQLAEKFSVIFDAIRKENRRVADERCRRLLLENDSRNMRPLKQYSSLSEFDRDVRRTQMEFLAEPNLGEGRIHFLNQFLKVQQIRRTILDFNLRTKAVSERSPTPLEDGVSKERRELAMQSPLRPSEVVEKEVLETCFLVFHSSSVLHTHRFRIFPERAYLFDFVQDHYRLGYCVNSLCYFKEHYFVNVFQDYAHEFHEKIVMCKMRHLRKTLFVLRRKYGYENLTNAVYDGSVWVLVLRNDQSQSRDTIVDSNFDVLEKKILSLCEDNEHGVEMLYCSEKENVVVLKRRPSKKYYYFSGNLADMDRLVQEYLIQKRFTLTALLKVPSVADFEEEEGEIHLPDEDNDRYVFCCKEKTTLVPPVYRRLKSSLFVNKSIENLVLEVLERGYVAWSMSS